MLPDDFQDQLQRRPVDKPVDRYRETAMPTDLDPPRLNRPGRGFGPRKLDRHKPAIAPFSSCRRQV